MVIDDCLTYDIFHRPHKKHSEYRTKANLWLVEDTSVYTLHIIKMMKTFRFLFSAADLLTIIIIEHSIERKFKIDKYYEFTYVYIIRFCLDVMNHTRRKIQKECIWWDYNRSCWCYYAILLSPPNNEQSIKQFNCMSNTTTVHSIKWE